MSSVKRKKVVRTRAVKAKKGLAKKRPSFPRWVEDMSADQMFQSTVAAIHAVSALVAWAAVTHFHDRDDPIDDAAIAVGQALLAAADQFGEWNDRGLK